MAVSKQPSAYRMKQAPASHNRSPKNKEPATKSSDTTQTKTDCVPQSQPMPSTSQTTLPLSPAPAVPPPPTRILPVLPNTNPPPIPHDFNATGHSSACDSLVGGFTLSAEQLSHAHDWYNYLGKVLAQELGHLSTLVDVLTINGSCPPSIVLSLKDLRSSETGKVYVVFGTAVHVQGSGKQPTSRPYFLVCHDRECYTGKTADTYQATLHWLSDGVTLPDWVVPSGSVTKQPTEGSLYLMNKDLLHFLCRYYFDIDKNSSRSTQRVFVKLPRTDGAALGDPRTSLNAAQIQHHIRVLQNFTVEREAEVRLSPPLLNTADGATSSSSIELPHRGDNLMDGDAQVQIVPRRLFDVRLAPLKVIDAKQGGLCNIFESEYPVWHDHGPSLDLVISALKARARGSGGTNEAENPALHAVVERLTATEPVWQSIVGDVYSEAMAKLLYIHTREMLHGSIAERNICIELKEDTSKGEQTCDRESSGSKPGLNVQFIDFAKISTKETYYQYYNDKVKGQRKWQKAQALEIKNLESVMKGLSKAVLNARTGGQ